jgi:hypothetical protein
MSGEADASFAPEPPPAPFVPPAPGAPPVRVAPPAPAEAPPVIPATSLDASGACPPALAGLPLPHPSGAASANPSAPIQTVLPVIPAVLAGYVDDLQLQKIADVGLLRRVPSLFVGRGRQFVAGVADDCQPLRREIADLWDR